VLLLLLETWLLWGLPVVLLLLAVLLWLEVLLTQAQQAPLAWHAWHDSPYGLPSSALLTFGLGLLLLLWVLWIGRPVVALPGAESTVS